MWQQRLTAGRFVNPGIKTANQTCDRDSEDLADSEQCRHGDWPSRFHLLPVASGENPKEIMSSCE